TILVGNSILEWVMITIDPDFLEHPLVVEHDEVVGIRLRIESFPQRDDLGFECRDPARVLGIRGRRLGPRGPAGRRRLSVAGFSVDRRPELPPGRSLRPRGVW